MIGSVTDPSDFQATDTAAEEPSKKASLVPDACEADAPDTKEEGSHDSEGARWERRLGRAGWMPAAWATDWDNTPSETWTLDEPVNHALHKATAVPIVCSYAK